MNEKPISRWAMMPANRLAIHVAEAVKIYRTHKKSGDRDCREIDALQMSLEKQVKAEAKK